MKLFHINLLKKYHDRPTHEKDKEPEVTEDVIASACIGVVDESVENEELIPTVGGKETLKDVDVCSELTEEEAKQLWELLKRYEHLFTDLPGLTSLLKHDIKLTSKTPIRKKSYPIPFQLLPIIKKELEFMQQLDVIEHSNSPYSSPYLLIKKPDGSIRFCIDFRALNAISVFDGEPIPDVEEMFVRFAKKIYYTEFDCSKGFWNLGLTKAAKELTAFATPLGHFQFKVMPFGLQGAPSSFSRLMRRVLGNDNEDVTNFIDNVMISSNTWEEHLAAIEDVLKKFENANMTLRPTKCHIGYRELQCLGFIVGNGMVKPVESKVNGILQAPAPKTKKQVRSFIGMVGFYRKFIPNFSILSAPLTDLTKKGQPNKVKWTDVHDRAFQTLKNAMVSSPILILPDLNKPFVLRTDASSRAIGAALFQKVNNTLMPVAYASKKLSQPENNYAVVEKECLAIVWGIQKFARYLYGQQFVVESDHAPLRYLQSGNLTNGRLLRWAMALQPYRYTVSPIKGIENRTADYLSRMDFDE